MYQIMVKLLIVVALISIAVSQDAQPSSSLVQLTESNIDDLVFNPSDDHDWLVMFSAPWCGWCKQLEPEFLKAAEEHPNEKYNVKFAKADCTTEKSFNTRFDIEGYPTVKLIRDKTVFNAGPFRNSTQIDEYIHRIVTLPVLRFSPEPLPKEFRSDPYFILFGNQNVMDPNSPVMQKFSKAAWRMLPYFIRSYRIYEDVPSPYIKRVAAGAPDLIYKISDEETLTVEDLVNFMQNNKKPLVAEVKVDNFKELVKAQQQWVVLAIDPERHQTALDGFRKAAAADPEGIMFVWINSVVYPEWLKTFGVDSNQPGVFVYDPNMERHWRSSNLSLDSGDEILQFIADVKDGKIETMGPGRYHPAYLLRRFYQWLTSSFYEYSFSYEFAAAAFCMLTTLMVIMWTCIRFALRSKSKKQKQQ